ncbi:MAG: hypothetical protein JNK53_06110, partial [Phycisphaerae bacterium]|nr:hypothetical protein [Phycisphaerae bacterium]
HLDRGYNRMDRTLAMLGASIERCSETRQEVSEESVPAIMPSVRGAGLTARAAQEPKSGSSEG